MTTPLAALREQLERIDTDANPMVLASDLRKTLKKVSAWEATLGKREASDLKKARADEKPAHQKDLKLREELASAISDADLRIFELMRGLYALSASRTAASGELRTITERASIRAARLGLPAPAEHKNPLGADVNTTTMGFLSDFMTSFHKAQSALEPLGKQAKIEDLSKTAKQLKDSHSIVK